MKFTRFTRPGFLRQVGRRLLEQLWSRFESDLAARGLALPAPSLDDESYYNALADLVRAPQGLPENLTETLYAIEEMSDPKGQEALERAIGQAQMDLRFDDELSRGDLAVQVWLARPELLAAKHHERRVKRLAKFEYYGGSSGKNAARGLRNAESDHFIRNPHLQPHSHPVGEEPGCTAPYVGPSPAVLERLTDDLDWWFQRHNRGHQTTRLEMFPVEDGVAFMVRHGDTLTRRETVHNGRLSMVHFRPLKDDVVVYAPERDQIGIHAGTKGERDLYRVAFGHWLFGDARYFSQRHGLTLDPLRQMGRDALNTDRLRGVKEIVLRELEVKRDNSFGGAMVYVSKDLFAEAAAAGDAREAIPAQGELVRATFDFHFAAHGGPQKVEVRLPNLLKMGRNCDAPQIHRWLRIMSFSRPVSGLTTCALRNWERGFLRGGMSHV